jgi:hypothetical protein
MRKTKVDPDIHAIARWHEALERVGVVKPGDLVMSLTIKDGENERDAIMWFIDVNSLAITTP